MTLAFSARRHIAAAFLVCLALLAAGYTAYWFHVAGLVGKAAVQWSDERRAAGWQVAYDRLDVSGFPLRLVVRLDNPSLTAPGGLGWRAESLTLRAWPFHLGHVSLTAPGRHLLTFDGQAAAIAAAELAADLRLDSDGRLAHLRAAAGTVTVDGTGDPAAGADSLSLTLDRPAAADPLTPQTPVLAFAAEAAGLRLPPLSGVTLGRRIAAATVTGRVLGPVPPAGPGTSEAPLDALARWSAAGGTVAVDHLGLDWDPLGLDARGTLALDSRLQPLAAFSARMRGYAQLMDRLAEARMVDRGAANAAKLMLSLLARPDSQGRPAVPVPLTVQDGLLWLGPARIGAVPPIPWPARLVRPAGR